MSASSDSTAVIAPRAAAGARAHPRVRRSELALFGALIAAAALRFVDLAGAGYWHDEIFTVDLVRLPFGRMLHQIPKTEGTPPLYYALAWLWSRAFGTTEAGLRSLSALVGVLTVVPMYIAGRLLFRPRAAAAAALLAATSPVLVWYGQEARSYELGTLATATSMAAVAAAARRGPTGRIVALWTAASLVALATHYFTVFAIAPEAWWLIRLSRVRGRRYVLAGSAVVAAEGVALVPLVLAQRGNPSWIAASGLLRRVLEVPSELLAGPQPSVALLAVPVLGLSLAGLVIVFRGEAAQRAPAGQLLGVGAAFVLLPLGLALAGADYFAARNLVFAWPFVFLAVAAAAGSSRPGVAVVGAILVVNVCAVAATIGQSKYGREDWRAAAAALGAQHGARVVVLSPRDGQNVLAYYLPRMSTLAPAAAARVAEVDVVGLPPVDHPVGRNPVPPRPASPPRLAGFRLAARELRGGFTLFRLRAPRPAVVPVHRLLALALGRSPALMVERRP